MWVCEKCNRKYPWVTQGHMIPSGGKCFRCVCPSRWSPADEAMYQKALKESAVKAPK